jgi:hypothetical protein
MRAALPIGEVLDEAARLIVGQAPGTISLDEATAGLARGPLRGRAASRHATAPAREGVAREAPRSVLGKELPCLGRDRELGALEALWDEWPGRAGGARGAG